MLFALVLNKVVKRGSLRIIGPDGRHVDVGDGTGERLTIRLSEPGLSRRLAFNPHLVLGEAYMDGTLTVEDGSIYDLIALLMSNLQGGWGTRLASVLAFGRWARRRFDQFNTASNAQANVHHHYDLDAGLYDLFLDTDKQYSCGYFDTAESTLEDAQLAKKRHIAAKLDLKPGMRVLEIGCGWGGLALYLAEQTGCEVVGISLSEEQLKIAIARGKESPAADRISFRMQDYRAVEEKFDRVVSVGMFENVGVGFIGTFFNSVYDVLKEDGVALLHSIGRFEGPGATNPWIAKYIFPGGYIPALSEVIPHVEKSGLLTTDIEILRLHYASTLREWRDRFVANWDRAASIYDERFCRMWEFYLAASEASFRWDGMMVFQMQLAKKVDALPLTRDYMVDWEREHRRPSHNDGRRYAGD